MMTIEKHLFCESLFPKVLQHAAAYNKHSSFHSTSIPELIVAQSAQWMQLNSFQKNCFVYGFVSSLSSACYHHWNWKLYLWCFEVSSSWTRKIYTYIYIFLFFFTTKPWLSAIKSCALCNMKTLLNIIWGNVWERQWKDFISANDVIEN